MRGDLEALVRPLTHYADFRGRARLTELVGIWLLLMLAGLLGNLAVELAGLSRIADYQAVHSVQLLFMAPLACPTVATFVRRLHDQGRSGWWLLIGAPGVATGLMENWRELTLGLDSLATQEPMFIQLAGLFSLLVVFVLLCLPEQPGTNRYGPDPRFREVKAAD